MEVKEISDEVMSKLVKKASKEENKLILVTNEYKVWTNAGDEGYECEVILGEARVLDLEEEGYGGSTGGRKHYERAYIPLTIPTVVKCVSWRDFIGTYDDYYHEELHIFTKDGWKKVKVK